MPNTKHIWIDGPDGPKYHCPICGVSRADDCGRYDTCEKFILHQAEQITRISLPVSLSGETSKWKRFLEQQGNKKDTTKTRGSFPEWFARALGWK